MKQLAFLFLTVTLAWAAQGQAYKIDFKINGWKDTTAYLAYYYGESTYIADTARTKNGILSFTGKKALGQGVYILVVNSKVNGKLNSTKLFDMVIGEDQTFALETNAEDFVKNMKVTGDVDNKLFFDNMMFNADLGKDAEPFIKVLRDSTLSEDEKKSAREGYQAIGKKVTAYQDGLIKNNPKSVTARLLKATKEVEIPEAPKLPNGKADSTWQYKYYKQHFWDNFDIADDALIRMPRPFYQEKLKSYLTKMVVPQADSLLKEIHRLASIARKNQETYKYLVWMCVVQYQNVEIMGLDAVYIGLFDKYFATKEMDFWINEKTKKNLKDHADQLRISLIGMNAPNLIMQDQNLQPRNMHELKSKYTILFIFDPDCGHCREETPKLVSFYHAHKKKFDFEVYAVSADSSLKKMKDFIKEFNTPWVTVNGPRSYVGSYHKLYDAPTTPTVYIIDNKKKIIAKKPPIESLEGFLTHFENQQKKQAKPSTP